MGEYVLKVEGVSKKFARRVRHSLVYGTVDVARGMLGMEAGTERLRTGEFWAVDGVSFELGRGETLGLIGMNGSGKTTLLRMLNGIFPPDRGRIEIRGRMGALIAVGAGFHPLMTGRENIYLNGVIMGMSRAEIDGKFDDIAGFAEIGDFLDAPVKTYSSGMRVRLGFAVAIHSDPDILLVDEVLAVGDFRFRQKCMDRMNELRKRTSVMIVSHNLRDIGMLCDRAIVMDGGKAAFLGGAGESVEYFLDIAQRQDGRKLEDGLGPAGMPGIYGERFHNEEKIAEVRHVWLGNSGKPDRNIRHGGEVLLDFSFTIKDRSENLIVGLAFYSQSGQLVSGMATDQTKGRMQVGAGRRVNGRLVISPVVFNPGEYAAVFSVLNGKEVLYRELVGGITIGEMPVYAGLVTLGHRWEL